MLGAVNIITYSRRGAGEGGGISSKILHFDCRGEKGGLEPVNGRKKRKDSKIEVDLPPFYIIFDTYIFDTVLIRVTSLPPLEFLTKIMKF